MQAPRSDLYREVHNGNDSDDNDLLPGALILTEGQPIAQDSEEAISDCYDNLGRTFDFYFKILKRNSIDDRGLPLIGTIHFGKEYGNAFWNSKQMVFGDGNTLIYNFTKALDVIGHELTHGVTENTAGLDYHNQSGALNESVSDVFGVMVKQFHLNQKAADADWLIGEDCLLPGVKGVALRSMKAPGTAFDDPRFGKDPQPPSMADYQQSSDDDDGDYGGVHTNSGIPNRAFYLAAMGLGGYAWERAGKIWYHTLLDQKIKSDCGFKAFADITCAVAGRIFDKEVQAVVRKAWVEVEVYDS
ncbi:Translation initiation factor 3 subunit b [Xylographa bjoerkii]|nr:Translation initiation factor 3 subunit b [Xylographa bjoerkii]